LGSSLNKSRLKGLRSVGWEHSQPGKMVFKAEKRGQVRTSTGIILGVAKGLS